MDKELYDYYKKRFGKRYDRALKWQEDIVQNEKGKAGYERIEIDNREGGNLEALYKHYIGNKAAWQIPPHLKPLYYAYNEGESKKGNADKLDHIDIPAKGTPASKRWKIVKDASGDELMNLYKISDEYDKYEGQVEADKEEERKRKWEEKHGEWKPPEGEAFTDPPWVKQKHVAMENEDSFIGYEALRKDDIKVRNSIFEDLLEDELSDLETPSPVDEKPGIQEEGATPAEVMMEKQGEIADMMTMQAEIQAGQTAQIGPQTMEEVVPEVNKSESATPTTADFFKSNGVSTGDMVSAIKSQPNVEYKDSSQVEQEEKLEQSRNKMNKLANNERFKKDLKDFSTGFSIGMNMSGMFRPRF